MKCKSILFFILSFFVGYQAALAQGKTVEVAVKQVEQGKAEGKPQSGVEVYGFYDLSKARKFVKHLKTDVAFTPRLGRDFDCEAITGVEGFCNLVLPPTGAVVVRPSFNEPELLAVKDRLSLTFLLKNEGKVMQELVKTVYIKRKNKRIPSRRLGNRKVLGPFPYYLTELEANSQARFGLAPVVIELETGDTFMISRPFLIDGLNYKRTQKRFMGFDEANDPLIPYRAAHYMRTGEPDSIMVWMDIYPIDVKKHYRITATKWIENYHNVYVRDSICLDEGYDRNPMRFLDYEMMQTDINRERYKREGRRELMNDSRRLNLKFMVGKAELDPSDSLNYIQLDRLKSDLQRYMNDADAGITSVYVHGQASPDGGRNINKQLCHDRAEFLKADIAASFPSIKGLMKAEADVAGWDKVVQFLEEDSLTEYANEVRQIINQNKAEVVQERKIRALPYFEMIRDSILPRLRVVDFTFNYFVNRVRTPEEIFHLYETDPGYKNGSKQMPYEFYHLFQMVNNPDDLEVLAKAAMKTVRDEDYQKPWPLAAYILSQCYLKRDTFDTNLLKPYLDWKRAGHVEPEFHTRSIDGSWTGWVNDEAIVTSYITHLCKSGDYYMADSVAVNLLPDAPRYERMKCFLDCLNGMWGDPHVRDVVAASSPWNKVVVYAAQDDYQPASRSYHEQALEALQNDTVNFNPEDPKVLYMIATLRYRLEAENKDRKEYPEMHFQFDEFFEPSAENPNVDQYGDKRQDWGYPMIQCCLKDEKYLQYMLYDGEFNKQYRTAFMKVWKKLKANGNKNNAE